MAKYEPGLQSALDPPSVSPKPLCPQSRKLRAADCGHSFTSRIGAGLGALDRTVRINSKSPANVLCAQYRRFKEDALAMRPSEAFLVSPR